MSYLRKVRRKYWPRFMAPDESCDSSPVITVLVTRPEGTAAQALVEKVSAAGYAACSQPLLELWKLENLDDRVQQMAGHLDLYQHVIFISANAVKFGLQEFQKVWPELPGGIDWYAVGGATAALLQSRGINAQAPDLSMDSEGLLMVPSLQEVDGRRILIVKGAGGRNTIAQELSSRGAQVDEFICYERHLPTLQKGELANKLVQHKVAVVMLSSGEGFTNFQLLLSPAETSNFSHLCLIVPSQRVAEMALNAGYETVITAQNASDAAMLRALEAWKTSSGD